MTGRVVAATIAAMLLGGGVAAAQVSGSAAREEAQKLNTEAFDLRDKGDHAGALDKFQRAYAVYPSPKVLLNIAKALNDLGRIAEAANVYQRYLDDPGSDAAQRPKVEKILVDFDKKVGVVKISVTPVDAQVQIAGWAPGWIPPGGGTPWLPAAQAVTWRVTPGPFTAQARKDGFLPVEQNGSVNAGAVVAVSFTLAEKPPEPVVEAKPDDVAVVTEPEAVIEQPVDATPPAKAVRLGALVEVAIDGKGQGAAVAPGISVLLSDRIELSAKALVGGAFGAFVGARVYLTSGSLRPHLGAGLPVFFSDGARVAVRGAAGVTLKLGDRLGLVGEVGGEYFVNPEMDRVDFVLVPIIGVHARL